MNVYIISSKMSDQRLSIHDMFDFAKRQFAVYDPINYRPWSFCTGIEARFIPVGLSHVNGILG